MLDSCQDQSGNEAVPLEAGACRHPTASAYHVVRGPLWPLARPERNALGFTNVANLVEFALAKRPSDANHGKTTQCKPLDSFQGTI
jgi:hypothetical protein